MLPLARARQVFHQATMVFCHPAPGNHRSFRDSLAPGRGGPQRLGKLPEQSLRLTADRQAEEPMAPLASVFFTLLGCSLIRELGLGTLLVCFSKTTSNVPSPAQSSFTLVAWTAEFLELPWRSADSCIPALLSESHHRRLSDPEGAIRFRRNRLAGDLHDGLPMHGSVTESG
jgi:hypothetical protein